MPAAVIALLPYHLVLEARPTLSSQAPDTATIVYNIGGMALACSLRSPPLLCS